MSHFHFLNKVQPKHVEELQCGENTAAVLLKKRTISVQESPMPILQPDGVLVKVISTGTSSALLSRSCG
jgi:D-xylulose reductase